jgi:hypothetical protein
MKEKRGSEDDFGSNGTHFTTLGPGNFGTQKQTSCREGRLHTKARNIHDCVITLSKDTRQSNLHQTYRNNPRKEDRRTPHSKRLTAQEDFKAVEEASNHNAKES